MLVIQLNDDVIIEKNHGLERGQIIGVLEKGYLVRYGSGLVGKFKSHEIIAVCLKNGGLLL